MYSAAQLFFKYLRYRINALNGKGHGAHSPFVYAFIKHLLNDKRSFYAYEQVEQIRAQMRKDQRRIQVEDFGAGSRVHSSSTRKVSAMAASSLKPKKYGQLLFRMVAYFQPQTILELGTSLGITSAYLALANPEAKVWSMEGAPAIADIAEANFKTLGIDHIQMVRGDFDKTLAPLLDGIESLDFVFVDGNHRYAPTINYFHLLKPKMREHSILVFDDIHWSQEMEAAWEEIKKDKSISLTIDLFFIGIVFFRKEQLVKQDFVIHY
ncbi:MAG: SAM-dependent methyltransferase [Chitinophagaceae bacterium BSSC1]|nr:MAG: SAM-dependent methyltransferase [Chitinophagaceae bacterium BSSC1]